MSEKVQFNLEKSIAELRDLVEKKIFTQVRVMPVHYVFCADLADLVSRLRFLKL